MLAESDGICFSVVVDAKAVLQNASAGQVSSNTYDQTVEDSRLATMSKSLFVFK